MNYSEFKQLLESAIHQINYTIEHEKEFNQLELFLIYKETTTAVYQADGAIEALKRTYDGLEEFERLYKEYNEKRLKYRVTEIRIIEQLESILSGEV